METAILLLEERRIMESHGRWIIARVRLPCMVGVMVDLEQEG